MNKKIFASAMLRVLVAVFIALLAPGAMSMDLYPTASDTPVFLAADSPQLDGMPQAGINQSAPESVANTDDPITAPIAINTVWMIDHASAGSDYWRSSLDMPVNIGVQTPGYSAPPEKVAIRFRF